MTAFTLPTIVRPIRHLRRYRYILTVFTRHGFGFAISHLPTEPLWLRELYPFPSQEPSSLPAHFRQALEELGPAFVKLGQVLSTRPDLLPPGYIAELSRLQDSVAPVKWEDIRQVLEEDLGAPPEALFDEIDNVPLAAASLAQVHAGKLHTRQKVAIKVQRPRIQPTLNTDLEIIHDLARYVQAHTPLGRVYDLVEMVEDFSDTLHSELDYLAEGRNADMFRRNFEGEDGVHIPHIYWEYTTERVLVMEYIEGIKIDNIGALDASGYNRQAIAHNAAQMVIKEVLEDGCFHADPHPGNFVVMKNEVIGAMDFGMVGYLSHTDRVALVRLANMALRIDALGVTDELIHIGAAPPDVDRRALARDIERLLRRYHTLSLGDIRINSLLDEVMPIAFGHHLRLPTNYWLLGKTLAMMEGIGLQLAPDFDIFSFAAPHVSRLMLSAALPGRRWVQDMTRRGLAWVDLLDELPHVGTLLLDRLVKREPIRLSLDQSTMDVLDRWVTRLALSLIIAGMIVGLAGLIPAVTNTSWVVQAIVISSFVLAIAMGAWVLFSIIRRK